MPLAILLYTNGVFVSSSKTESKWNTDFPSTFSVNPVCTKVSTAPDFSSDHALFSFDFFSFLGDSSDCVLRGRIRTATATMETKNSYRMRMSIINDKTIVYRWRLTSYLWYSVEPSHLDWWQSLDWEQRLSLSRSSFWESSSGGTEQIPGDAESSCPATTTRQNENRSSCCSAMD